MYKKTRLSKHTVIFETTVKDFHEDMAKELVEIPMSRQALVNSDDTKVLIQFTLDLQYADEEPREASSEAR